MFPILARPLGFMEILNAGWAHYREVICSVETFEWMRSGGVSVIDGVPVRASVSEVCVGGHNVVVKLEPLA